MMAVNHDMMAGKDEISDLAALRDFVSDYYDGRIASSQNSDDIDWLNQQKSQLTSSLNKEIRIKTGYDMLNTFLSIYTGGDVKENSSQSSDKDVRHIVSGSSQPSQDDEYDPSTDYFNVMNSLVMTDIDTLVKVVLDIDIIDSHPSLAPVIQDSSTWSYSTSQVNESSADFWNQSDNDDDTDSSAANDDIPADTIDIHKPVRFINNGFEAVTVVVESYKPAPGLNEAVSSASTVVFPESNPSAFLELPQGTYTFCYYWQLDTDYNNDDYFDYHHRSTSSVTLSENSSNNPENAVTVTLSPDSVVSNPNGKCGENSTANPGNGNLTPEEAANAGTHTYLVTCQGNEICGGESDFMTFNIVFGDSSFTLTGEGENEYFTRAGENQYNWTNSDGEVFTLFFTRDGFYYSWDFYDVIIYYTLSAN